MPATPRSPRSLLSHALLVALSLPGPLVAADPAPPPQDPRHEEPTDLDAVIVHATPLPATTEDLVQPVEVLAGERLDEAKANSLGETVNKLPGVQSSYFGPGVGRPVIRGFDGARVQVLSGGLASGDVSTVSVDHAVSIEPFLASQIEVLKGPATLLYGSGAIGGAVNVIDGRVPERTTLDPFQGRAELRAGTVNDERTGMLRLDGTADQVVFHFDAMHRETGDYAIPGFAESAHAHEEEHDDTDHEDVSGVLPNSALRTDAAALGVSWVGDGRFLGAAYSLFNSRYGVPGHSHAHEEDEEEHVEEHEHGEEAVTIVMDQRRSEVRGGLDRFGAFESLRVKLAQTDYTHTEYEGEEVGTVFDNTATEARIELVHGPLAGWDGAFGAQWSQRDFRAAGEEAFVPASTGRDAGVFWVGGREFGDLKIELGARHDRTRIDVDDAVVPATGRVRQDRSFDASSASAALRWDMSEAFHLSFGVDRAQRAPTAEELYSGGLHVATASIELGDAHLDVETASRAELGMHWHDGPLQVGISLYQVDFDDFIYLAETGISEGDTLVRQWTQHDARFRGAEAELDWAFLDNASGQWALRVFGDVVRAALDGSGSRDIVVSVPHDGHIDDYAVTLSNSGDLPRIVPARLGGELRWEHARWRASLGAVRYVTQDRTAGIEAPTPGHTLVDAHLAWHLDTRHDNAWEVFLDGSNLLDEEARVHTSFLKDLAPLPGRGIAFGVRTFF